ncbi:MAG: hypothetical protein IPL83_07230 [Bdellovibrionales bacterium]|nr:hypothetical protein [Bdellovibrionales bacterium]
MFWDYYFGGFLIVFFFRLYRMFLSIAHPYLYSQRTKNMKKIGLSYNFMYEGYTKGNIVWMVFPLFIYNFLAYSCLSWIYIVFKTAMFWLSLKESKFETPDGIRQILFKIDEEDLSVEEMVSLFKSNPRLIWSLHYITDKCKCELDFDDNFPTCRLDDRLKVEVDAKNRKLFLYSSNEGFSSSSVNEYRFDGSKLISRCLEYRTSDYGKKERLIMDNVVLESEVRRLYSDDIDRFGSAEGEIKELKEMAQWSEVQRFDLRFFVLSRHTELFSKTEFRKIVRNEMERIKSGVFFFREECRKLGLETLQYKDGTRIEIPDKTENSEYDIQVPFPVIADSLYASANDFGITEYELCIHSRIEALLASYLNEEAA